MNSTAFVTGGDRGLGLALCAGLLERGWEVYAGQYLPDWPELAALAARFPRALHRVLLDVSSAESIQAAAQAVAAGAGYLDLLINNAGVNSPTSGRAIREPQDYAEMRRLYEINALGPLRVVEAFLPLTDRGRHKRLGFVSSEAGSIGRAERTAWFGYCMSKAALNMQVKLLFNALHPQGYTFRVVHPGWVRSFIGGEKNMAATLEPEEAAARLLPLFLEPRADESQLVLENGEGQTWPW